MIFDVGTFQFQILNCCCLRYDLFVRHYGFFQHCGWPEGIEAQGPMPLKLWFTENLLSWGVTAGPSLHALHIHHLMFTFKWDRENAVHPINIPYLLGLS